MAIQYPWPLCSLWWRDNWPHGAPGTDPPKIGVLECASSRTSARSRTRGNSVRFYYVLTTCEPHRCFNRRDNAWARVFFLARLGLKATVCVIREGHACNYFSCREQRTPIWILSLAAELLALPSHFFARSATGCRPNPRFNNTTDL
jgi:hypothetical protein